jgi:diguanylate cyclase
MENEKMSPRAKPASAAHDSVVRAVLTDARYAPWRDEALQRGYASVISLPVGVDEIVTGALTIYAAEPDAFDDEERWLLVGTAAGLGFGVSSLRMRQKAGESDAAIWRMASYDELTGLPNRCDCASFSLR